MERPFVDIFLNDDTEAFSTAIKYVLNDIVEKDADGKRKNKANTFLNGLPGYIASNDFKLIYEKVFILFQARVIQ